MLHILELINPGNARTGVNAQAKIPISGNIVEFTVYAESTPTQILGLNHKWDLLIGAPGATASAFADANRPALTPGLLQADANAAGFPIPCTEGDTVELYKYPSVTVNRAGFRITGRVVIDDGLLNESTVVKVSGSLAHLAEELSTVPLGKNFLITGIAVDEPARVTLYRSPAYRAADIARPIGTLPEGDHGVILDANLTDSNGLAKDIARGLFGKTAELPRSGDIAARIQNRSGITDTITVTFTINKLEA